MAGEAMSPAAQHHREQMFARRAAINHRAMVAFSGSIAGLAVIFIGFHMFRVLGRKMGLHQKNTKSPSLPVMASRVIRKVLLRKVPVLPTLGHAGLITLYLAINIVLTVTPMDASEMGWIPCLASRTAWLAIVNTVVVVVLALKNTPLAYLTAWSYERLNILHQAAGCLTVAFVILHASLYSAYFVQAGRASRLLYMEEIFGMVAGVSFVGLWFVGTVIRAWWYELFYYLHISLWMLGIVMTGLHQPELGKGIIFAVVVAAGVWVLDRIIRLSRFLFHSTNNSATLTPLPNGATRVTLKKPPFGATSGKHCFLWIPRIRTTEAHPFTIAAMDPLEFVVSSYDGFTRDLHRYASANPGVTVTASVDGPYGTFPDPAEYDRLFMVAGGSGATFTFGTALNALKKMGTSNKITFIWIVKSEEHLKWFSQHLKTLESDPRVTVLVFVTRSSSRKAISEGETSDSGNSSSGLPTDVPLTEKRVDSTVESPRSTGVWANTENVESAAESSIASSEKLSVPNVTIAYERPDISAHIRSAVDQTPKNEALLVMGCGPDGLMKTVRNTTAACIQSDGPAIELHCEQFGW